LSAAVAWLRRAVHEELLVLVDQHRPNETGGLLLGYRHGPREIVITDATGPGPNAVHRRDGFEPDTEWQSAELARRYFEAQRRISYVGDWHSHPGGAALLSKTDRITLRTISRHPEARCPRPLMAIVAGGDPWKLGVWQAARTPLRRGRVEPLAVRLYA